MISVYLPQAALVAAFGAFVGFGELLSRYSANPGEAVRTLWFWVYVGINAAASLAAFAVIRLQGWSFGTNGTVSGVLAAMLVAGFGAMALFRSSLFVVQIAGTQVPIGPVSFLQVILDAADNQVNRRLAADTGADMERFMAKVSFDKAKDALPAYCIALVQNMSQTDQQSLSDHVKAIGALGIDDGVKARLLGVVLDNVVGDDVLKEAVKDLSQSIDGAGVNGNSIQQPKSPAATLTP